MPTYLGHTTTKGNADLDQLKADAEAGASAVAAAAAADATAKANAAQAAAAIDATSKADAAETVAVATAAADATAKADAAQAAAEAHADAGDTVLQAAISALEAGQDAGVVGFATKALMDADLAHDADTIAYVTNDPTTNNNTTYRKSGASGAGSWVAASSDRIVRAEASLRRWPFVDSASHAANPTTQNDAFRGIIDVWLYGTVPAYDVAVERIYRNYEATSGNFFWYISIKRTDTLVEVARLLYQNSDPEPTDPTEIAAYNLTDSAGSTVIGKILIRWSAITEAATPAANGAYGLVLDHGIWRDEDASDAEASPSFIVRNIHERVEELEDTSDPSSVRRGLVGLNNSHPFLRGATLSGTAVTGGPTSTDLLAMIERTIVDVVLYGTDPAETYQLERLRRNTAGGWFVTIRRQSDNTICTQLAVAVSPEPADPNFVSRHELSAINSNAYTVTGRIWIRWAEMTAGINNSILGLTLASTVKTPLGGTTAHNSPLVASLNELVTARGMQYVIMPDAGWVDGFTLADDGTLSWDQFVVVDPFGHSTGRVRIPAGSVVLNAAYQVVWVDVEAARSAATAPAGCVKVGTWFGGTTSDFKGLPHQLPLAAQAADGRRYLLPAALAVAGVEVPSVDVSGYGTDEVFASVVADTSVDVYMKGTGEDHAAYTRYRLERYTASDADVWTIMGVWEATRSDDDTFVTGKRICPEASEMLCAIQESGKADFMGGRAHGDETLEADPILLIDGAEIDLSVTATYRAREVAFIQFTSLWEALVLPHVNRRAYRRLWLTFRDGEMRTRQRIEWETALTLSAGYAAMLPLHRYETFVSGVSEDNTSAQISGKYVNDKEFEVEDCSAYDASAINWRSGIRRWRGWGTYGVCGEVEVLAVNGPFADTAGIQKNSYIYNKAYVGFVAPEAVLAGDVWTVETRWRITVAT